MNIFLKGLLFSFVSIFIFMYLSGCGSDYYIKQDYELAKQTDSVESYQEFLNNPGNRGSQEFRNALARIKELKDQKDKEERDKIFAKIKANQEENALRLSKIKGYKVSSTMHEDEFLRDGWNATDPWHGKLGIAGVVSSCGTTTYLLSYTNIDYPPDNSIDRFVKEINDCISSSRCSVNAAELNPSVIGHSTPHNALSDKPFVPVFSGLCKIIFKSKILDSVNCELINEIFTYRTTPIGPLMVINNHWDKENCDSR